MASKGLVAFLSILVVAALFSKSLLAGSGDRATLLWLTVVGCLVLLLLWVLRGRRRHLYISDIEQVDAMKGHDFERFAANLLSLMGYRVKVTTGSNDMGVDIIAQKATIRYAVQAKRYTGNVSRKAVSDAVGGMKHYQCNRSMVITNSYFTKGAQQLANSNKCTLVDRDELSKWISRHKTDYSSNGSAGLSKSSLTLSKSARLFLIIGIATLHSVALSYFLGYITYTDQLILELSNFTQLMIIYGVALGVPALVLAFMDSYRASGNGLEHPKTLLGSNYLKWLLLLQLTGTLLLLLLVLKDYF